MFRKIIGKIKTVRYIVNTIMFFAVNLFGYQLIPKIEEVPFKDTKIIPYSKRYLADLINLWITVENASFSKKNKWMLKLFGKKICFLMVDRNDRLIGFLYFYFHFFELINRRIHEALGGMNSEFRGRGYGSAFFMSNYNSFRKSKWIHEIGVRYSINNIASCKLHEKVGFKIRRKYFDENIKEERVYAIYDFSKRKLNNV